MQYCEECRVKRKLPRNPAWPYHGVLNSDKCELCLREGIAVHSVPLNYLKRPEDLDSNEKAVDNVQQEVYRLKCEELAIYYSRGPMAGRINESATKELNQVFLYRNGQVDWVHTFELRLKAREGYNKSEERKK